MEIKRKPFQGVLNILSFNRHFYVAGLAVLLLILATQYLFTWPALLFWLVIAAFIYGLLMPLIVSAYVYDFSGYYDLHWMDDIIADKKITLMVNINAGFDETSFLLKDKIATADLKVFDFYDASQHTEVAIKRARKVSMAYPDTKQISSDHIPLSNETVDAVFLLSAAHEIRSQQEKIKFLKECRRICKPGATIIMVEHLRDFPNFVAFSIGFTHFFSRSTWKKSFSNAGFSILKEKKFTAFMFVFYCSA